jgi:hypothetical protein
MICGLFTTILGKSGAGENASASSDGGTAMAVLEPPAASASAVPPAPAAPQAPSKAPATTDAAKPAVKACPQCGSTEPWGISSWCPNCFYHPRMGQMAAAAPPPDPEVRHLQPGYSHKSESYAELLKSLPLWGHMLWVGTVSIFALSVFMSFKLPQFGPQRAVWTLVQASLGLIAAGTAHVLVFFDAVPVTDKYGPFDLFLKPLDFWRYAIRKLPSKPWRLWMFAWGLTAVLSALVLIGGIRYSVIFETKSTVKKSTWYATPEFMPRGR